MSIFNENNIQSLEDGKLHKGFHFRDGSYAFGKKKKREDLSIDQSINQSDYFGLPYRIYSATPGYQNKTYMRKLIFLLFF